MTLNNGIQRILLAIVAIPLVIFLCYVGKIYFVFFIAILSLLAYNEFINLARNKNVFVNGKLGYLLVAFLIFNSYYSWIETGDLMVLSGIAILIYELFRNKESALLNSGVTILALIYCGLFFSYLIQIREIYNFSGFLYINGAYILISVLVGIWFCDTAAYFLGCAFGKHKLFPRVSPKKSWEGAIAGFLFTIIGMVVYKLVVQYFFLDFITMKNAIIMGIIIGSLGQIGDLIESLLKRDSGIKDSSSLLPGHGGILDRFDSLLITAPVIFIYLQTYVV